jgi:anaerobic ribonucleoside-triphosphate reductase activating protein
MNASRANGPGQRAVLWVQGCTLACPGCFNPDTHGQGGELVSVDDLVLWLTTLPDIQGITITGGEPLQQRSALITLLWRVRTETDLSILIFTGFTLEEISRMPAGRAFLALADVLLAGRYDQAQPRRAPGLAGLPGKTVDLRSDRYTLDDLAAVPEAEITITPDGTITLSGVQPLTFLLQEYAHGN